MSKETTGLLHFQFCTGSDFHSVVRVSDGHMLESTFSNV